MNLGGKVDLKTQRLVARLYREGWTQKVIGQRLGLKQCSVCQLLQAYRRRRCKLTVSAILARADAWHKRKGEWPKRDTGPIPGSGGDTWRSIDNALKVGLRGLPGGSSLAQLLQEQRGVANRQALPKLTVRRILGWADAHHAQTGGWPTEESGAVLDAPGEVWMNISMALRKGLRGLKGGTTLAQLLVNHRGESQRPARPALTVPTILAWADAHHRRTGQWPTVHSGPVLNAPGETWVAVNHALGRGRRGLPGGSSLAKVLTEHRAVRNAKRPPRLTRLQILAWARAHYRRTGAWPTAASGPIAEAPGETWKGIQLALVRGSRGLYKHASLHQVITHYRERLGRSRNGAN